MMSGPATREDLPPPGGHVHLMGVGGAGMRGLALLYRHLGYRVSGCDRSAGDLADLTGRGIRFDGDHDPGHVESVDLIIRSSAVPENSPEVMEAHRRGIPVLRRARALGAALNGRPLAGIAGTHGKTTITAMTGYACERAGLDPMVLVGGHVGAWDGFARPGAGPAIVEADEYDRSFLELDPTLALVSSLEAEHLDIYGDFDGVRAAFREFAGRAGSGVLYCADDHGARELGESMSGSRSYGFAEGSDYRLVPTGSQGRWDLFGPDGAVELFLRVPGRHNAQNAAGAYAAAASLGGESPRILEGLAAFPGVGRRLEVLGTWGATTVIDDYAHHPTEVAASIEALHAAYPDATVEVVFQPHLFSRTRDFAAEFAEALRAADRAAVLPIYPAREAPIEGVTSDLITRAGTAAPIDRDGALDRAARAGDGRRVVAFMGAGDVTEIARQAAAVLAAHAERSGP